MKKVPANLPASVHGRLLARAKAEKAIRNLMKHRLRPELVELQWAGLKDGARQRLSAIAKYEIIKLVQLDLFLEGIEIKDKAALDAITTLEVGEALFVGEVVSVPAFVKVRKRKFEPKETVRSVLDALRKADKKA